MFHIVISFTKGEIKYEYFMLIIRFILKLHLQNQFFLKSNYNLKVLITVITENAFKVADK